jgi:hypothetical protein
MGKLSLLRGSTNNTSYDVVNPIIGQFKYRYTRYLRNYFFYGRIVKENKRT